MNRAVARFALLLLAVVTTACQQDSTAPEGAPSTVTVRAYVDANGSGTFDAGDTAISDAVVALVGTGAADSLSATTDANGVATFESVEPGSYSVRFAGTAPEGAVLATAAQPVVVAPISGGEVAAEFRYVFFPGTLTGRLFQDVNSSGTFDSGDIPAPGMVVRVFEGTDTTVAPVATTTTSSTGEYSFSNLRPGTYTVVLTPFPTIEIVGGNAQTVTVTANQTTSASSLFTGSLTIPIAEARTKNPDDHVIVAVEGTVVAGLGTFNARSIYIQDSTGGIQVFGVDTDNVSPQLGDRVQVVGEIDAFNDELEIVDPVITITGSGTVPTPATVSGADVLAFEHQGELARAQAVRVVSVGGSATSTAYNVTVADLAGTEFTVRVANAGIGIPQTFWQVGNLYDVTGILIRFRDTPQLEPRSAEDVVASLPVTTIAAARALDSGTPVAVVGVATVAANASSPYGARTFYVQDATGGVMVFFNPTSSAVDVALGDSVRVSGIMSAFGGEAEIDRAVVALIKSSATVPAPQVVTAAQLNTLDQEGQLLRVNDAAVVSVGGGSSSAFNVVLKDAAGTEFQVRVSGSATGLTRDDFTVGSHYDVIGILGSFNGTGQLKPRSRADLIAR